MKGFIKDNETPADNETLKGDKDFQWYAFQNA